MPARRLSSMWSRRWLSSSAANSVSRLRLPRKSVSRLTNDRIHFMWLAPYDLQSRALLASSCSLAAQSGHGIDAGRAPRREVTTEGRRGQEQNGNATNRQGIARTYLVED